jgi:hypothetical protein
MEEIIAFPQLVKVSHDFVGAGCLMWHTFESFAQAILAYSRTLALPKIVWFAFP